MDARELLDDDQLATLIDAAEALDYDIDDPEEFHRRQQENAWAGSWPTL